MFYGCRERMQASGGYRCAEAVRWCSVDAGERMQGASWCYRCAEAGCRPAVAIDVLRPDAGCQLVLSMR